MATLQMTTPKQVTTSSTWEKVFPAEQKTIQQSELFVKKLLAVGISSILYLRDLFPESSYRGHSLDGLPLKLLADKSNSQSSNLVVAWIRSCFDAIEKKYLRKLTFAIQNKSNPLETYETYTYKFRYTDEGTVMTGLGTPSSMSKVMNDTVRETQKMLRTILLFTQTLKPLPKRICLSMRLGYYDDVTPPDYEPPNFTACQDGPYRFQSDCITIRMGNVSTRFHSTKLHVSVDKSVYSLEENENSPIDVHMKETPDEVEEVTEQEVKENADQENNIVRSYGSHSSQTSFMLLQSDEGGMHPLETLSENEDFPVRCPCGVQHDHGLMMMCDMCHKWQHAACFCILEDSEVPDHHVCEECASLSQPCTDPSLPGQPEIKMLCLFRRALVLLHHNKSHVIAATLAQQLGVDISLAGQILKRLQTEKIIYKRKKLNYVSRKKLVSYGLPVYLKRPGLSRDFHEAAEDINPEALHSVQTSCIVSSDAAFHNDATPDLDVSLLQESTSVLSNIEPSDNPLDETIDIMGTSQDVTVGTQKTELVTGPYLETSVSETHSEALATAGNTQAILDSVPAMLSTNCLMSDMPDTITSVVSACQKIGNQRSIVTSRQKARQNRLSRRASKRLVQNTPVLSDISMSQDSETKEAEGQVKKMRTA